MKASEFIRQHLDLKPAEIMALAKKQGVKINSIKRVYAERARQKAKGKAVAPARQGRKPKFIKMSANPTTPDIFTALIDSIVTVVTERVLERIRTAL